MTDITELIVADHDRIARLFAALDDVARYYAGPGRAACTDRTLSVMWERIAELLEAHADAEEEICYLAMFGFGEHRSSRIEEAAADLFDIREAVAEARLQQAGSDVWWLAVVAARRASDRHRAVLEGGVLDGFRHRVGERLRDDLGRQWAAFLAARARDARDEDDAGNRDRACPAARTPEHQDTPSPGAPAADQGARGARTWAHPRPGPVPPGQALWRFIII